MLPALSYLRPPSPHSLHGSFHYRRIHSFRTQSRRDATRRDFHMNANKKAAASKAAESTPGPSDAPSVPQIRHSLALCYRGRQYGEPLARYALNKVRTSSTSYIPCQSPPKSLLISRRVHALNSCRRKIPLVRLIIDETTVLVDIVIPSVVNMYF